MQTMLTECSEVTSENSDIEFIREQMQNGVDTLQFMASDAETRWKAVGVKVATAAGKFSLNRPADSVAWCAALIGASWSLYNGLRRELSGDNADLCVQRLPSHLGRIPNDIGEWQNRITAELRAGVLCEPEVPPMPPVFALEGYDVDFTNSSEAGSDDALTDDELGALERVVDDYFTLRTEDCLRDDDLLAHWWIDFLNGPLRNVRIGSDVYRRSRAGLIPAWMMADLMVEAGIDYAQATNFSLIEILEQIMVRREAGKPKTPKSGGEPTEAEIQVCISSIKANHHLWGDNPTQNAIFEAVGGARAKTLKAAKLAIERTKSATPPVR
jgi:hypothetical protein